MNRTRVLLEIRQMRFADVYESWRVGRNGAELHATIVDQADNYMGDRGGNMIGNPSQSVAKGVLQRAQ